MIRYSLFVLAIVVSFTACQESSTVGTVLLEDEKFEIQAKNDFTISSGIVEGEKTPTFIRGLSYSTYSIGDLDDPKFGTKSSELFFEMGFNTFLSRPNFAPHSLDSMVLVLAYDTLGYYGDIQATHQLDLYGLEQDLSEKDTIHLDETIESGTKLLGSVSLKYRPLDSISIINHTDTTLIKLRAQIRIPIDSVWAKELFSTESLYESDETLTEFFKGFVLKNSTSSSALLGINLSAANNSDGGLNKLTVFYTDSSDVKRVYNFRMRDAKGMVHQIDRTGSLTQELIDGVSNGDSLFLIEAHSGYDAKVVFEDLSFLDDKIVNHAKLKITIADLVDDDISLYEPTSQILATAINEDEEQEIIDDISDLALVGIPIPDGFGGSIIEEDGVKKYVMNVTKRIKDILSGDHIMEESEIIFNPFARIQIPDRCIMYGAGHSVYPIEFEVAYTLK